MIDKSKIAILSTVINFELYSKSSLLFPNDIQKYVIDGRTGMYGLDSLCYMMKKLKTKNIEWLIMADEDVLFVNSKLIFPLIEEMNQTGTMFCGVRDGGVIQYRNENPFVINTFFSIINFNELKKIWNKKEMLTHQYMIPGEFKDDLSQLEYKFDAKSLYEHYYCFYLWLRRLNKKVLFLDSKHPFKDDKITNAVCYNDEVLLYHTWYARSYAFNNEHTERINKILQLLRFENKVIYAAVVYKHQTFFLIKMIRKLRKRILMRVELILKNE